MARALSPAQVANQVTFVLKGHLKNVQLAYLRAGALLARVRDEQLWKALRHPSMEDYAVERLGLGRASLYLYLQVYDWVREFHPRWLGRKPKGRLPQLTDAAALMWIEHRLAAGVADPDRRRTLQRLQRRALAGTLTSAEFAAVRRRATSAALTLQGYLARLRALRRVADRVIPMPRALRDALDAAIWHGEVAVGAARRLARLSAARDVRVA